MCWIAPRDGRLEPGSLRQPADVPTCVTLSAEVYGHTGSGSSTTLVTPAGVPFVATEYWFAPYGGSREFLRLAEDGSARETLVECALGRGDVQPTCGYPRIVTAAADGRLAALLDTMSYYGISATAVQRRLGDGTPDPSFGDDGAIEVSGPSRRWEPITTAVALLSNGSIVYASTRRGPTVADLVLTRVTP